jgi:transcriptional regulator GlxA family with amidase domain
MEIVILLYPGFTALDVTGPYEVLVRLPNAVVKFAAKEKGIIDSEYPGMKMFASHTLAEIEKADILLIPGSTSAFFKMMKDSEVIRHIQRLDATTKWTTSVCSGAMIMAAAGLLKGKSATTHWALLDRLSTFGANPVAERYVHDGKFITAAGVSAGIDMALYLTATTQGEGYAKMVQLVIEYYPQPPLNVPAITAVPDEVKSAASAYLKEEIAAALY